MAETRARIQKQLEKSAVAGSIVRTDVNNEQEYVQPGTNGQVLTIVAGVPTWANLVAGFAGFSITDTVTTEAIASGDTITFAANNLLDVAISATDTVTHGINTSGATSGQVITFNGTNAVWGTAPAGVSVFRVTDSALHVTNTSAIYSTTNITIPADASRDRELVIYCSVSQMSTNLYGATPAVPLFYQILPEVNLNGAGWSGVFNDGSFTFLNGQVVGQFYNGVAVAGYTSVTIPAGVAFTVGTRVSVNVLAGAGQPHQFGVDNSVFHMEVMTK